MLTLKSLIVFFILCYIWSSYAQKEANIWYFGQNAGLDFSSGSPVALTNGQLNTDEGCATISDENGDLLFYTDGITVYNRNHDIMLNGRGLLGDSSSTHSAIIVPKPDDASKYYIFTVDNEGEPNGLQYSEIDLSLDGGLGAITNKNIQLETPVTEKITAVKSLTGYWVISHRFNSRDFIVFEVTAMGVDTNPVISTIGSLIELNVSAIGSIKISPDGKKIAVANLYLNVQLFDFDSATGILSNEITLLKGIEYYYAVEFSPNNKRLYISNGDGIFQFNLDTTDEEIIINSQVEITNATNPAFTYGQLQLANNGKIYIVRNSMDQMDLINNPNALGLACNYQEGAVSLDGRQGLIGLPTFIQSFFNIAFSARDVCFGGATVFSLNDTVDSIEWNFGYPASGINNTSTDLEPTHTFSAPGTYDVSATATLGGNVSTETVTVIIFEQPIATQPSDIEICDFFGNLTFNFTDQNAAILNGLDPNDFEITYYEGITNYNDGIPINMPETYSNPSSFFTQEIIAEIYNTENPECTDSTIFNIEVFKEPQLEIPENLIPLIQCDDIDSGSDIDTLSEFDLTTQEPFLLLNSTVTEVTFSYFTDPALTQPITTPTTFQNTQTPQTIYVEAVNNLVTFCRNSTSFTIEVAALPSITSEVELQQCDNDTDAISLFNLNEVINEITTNAINETYNFF